MSDAQKILKTLLLIHLSYTLQPIYEVKLCLYFQITFLLKNLAAVILIQATTITVK